MKVYSLLKKNAPEQFGLGFEWFDVIAGPKFWKTSASGCQVPYCYIPQLGVFNQIGIYPFLRPKSEYVAETLQEYLGTLLQSRQRIQGCLKLRVPSTSILLSLGNNAPGFWLAGGIFWTPGFFLNKERRQKKQQLPAQLYINPAQTKTHTTQLRFGSCFPFFENLRATYVCEWSWWVLVGSQLGSARLAPWVVFG